MEKVNLLKEIFDWFKREHDDLIYKYIREGIIISLEKNMEDYYDICEVENFDVENFEIKIDFPINKILHIDKVKIIKEVRDSLYTAFSDDYTLSISIEKIDFSIYMESYLLKIKRVSELDITETFSRWYFAELDGGYIGGLESDRINLSFDGGGILSDSENEKEDGALPKKDFLYLYFTFDSDFEYEAAEHFYDELGSLFSIDETIKVEMHRDCEIEIYRLTKEEKIVNEKEEIIKAISMMGTCIKTTMRMIKEYSEQSGSGNEMVKIFDDIIELYR